MIVRTYDDEDFRVHTLPLVAMGAVVAITLALTMSVSFGFFEQQANPDQVRAEKGVSAIDSRSVQFHDSADGSVWVSDGATGEELVRYPSGTGGFVRATARAVIHTRNVHGIGPAVPFQLVEYDNGAMALRDTETGAVIELATHGAAVTQVYRDILKKGRE